MKTENFSRAAMMLLLSVLTTATAWADNGYNYIGADGTQRNTYTDDGIADASVTVLTGGGAIDLEAGWYIVNSNISYTGTINLSGDVNLILADGGTMTVNADLYSLYKSMNIYCQSGGTGKLVINGEKRQDAIFNMILGTLTINGGTIDVTNNSNDHGSNALLVGGFIMNGGTATFTSIGTSDCINGNVTFNGGNLTVIAGSNAYGIYGNATLSHKATTDRFQAKRVGGTVTIADGKGFKDASGNIFVGTLTNEQKSAIAGQTLQPATQTEYIQACLGAGNDGSAEHPYTISDANGWTAFCLALQDNDTWNRFSGLTVKLGANIEVSRMAGSQKHDFCGTFDGYNNTLTFNYGTALEPATTDRVAPFSYISTTKANTNDAADSPAVIRRLNVVANINSSGQCASALVGEAWGKFTIEHCTVSGTITTSQQFAGGIIGSVSNSPLNITDCRSSVTINSSVEGDGSHGGFAGRVPSSATLNISGCVFDGKIVTTNTGETATTNCGGFVGHSENAAGTNVSITNSLCAPVADDNNVNEGCATFARNVVATNITNCYYTRALGTVQGKAPLAVTAGENVTIEAISPVGSPVENGTYSVSGITAYAKGITRTVGETTTFYYGQGDQVSLTLSNTAPAGYTFDGYEASNGGTITGTSNPYTLTLPNEDVTVSTTLTPNTYYVHFDGNGNTGGSMADQTFHYDEEQALSANAFTYANHTFIGWSLTPSLTPNENDNENENNSTIFADQESILNLTATDGETIYLYAQWILTPVPYIDQNGEQQFCTDYTVITEDEEYGCLSPDHLEAGGWYIFDDNLSVDTYTLSGSGAANIILVDGANYEIGGLDGNIAIKGSLNIYGQSNGTGNLELKGAIASHSSETDGKPAIQGDITLYGGSLKAYGGDGGGPSASQAYLCANGIDGSVTIYGGSLTSEGGTPFYYNKYGSCGISGNVTFYGGSLTAKGFNTDDPINDYEPGYGIGGNVTLSWTNTTDRFYANSIRGTVTVAQGKAFTSDGTDLYCGSVNPGSINGKTLSPAVEVTLACGLTPGSGIISLTPDPSPAGEGGNENHYYAKVGQTVTVAVPSTGCTLDSITPNTVVLNDNGDGTYSFTVPAEDVIVSGGDRTAPVHSDNDVWVYGTLYQDACLACFDMDLFLPQDQDLFDDCSPMTITHTDTRTGNDRDGWTIRRDYEVTDACGNTLHEFIEVSGRDQTPPMATNPEMKKDTLWAYAQCLCDSIRVINDLSELKTLFGLSDECTGDDISLVSKTRTFKIGNQGNHCPDTVVVAYTVADTYNNQSTFYHAQLIQDTTGPTFSIVPLDTSLCVDPDGDYVATVQRVAATATIEDIHDNCTRLQGNITVSAPTINFDPSENDNGGYTTDDNGIRTYYQVWSVTDSCGNTTRGTLEIHLYPLATIRIDSLDNQTITYGEDIKEVEVHSQYANVSVPDLGASDGITFSGNRLMGQPSAAGTYVYHPTATSWHECNSVETSVTVKVNPRPITITAASAIKKYDGKPLTSNDYICTLTPPFADMYYRILVGNDSIASVTITGSQTNVGTSQNVPREARITITTEPTADKSPSYAISYGNGTLEVIKNDTLIRVIPGSGSKVYDGTPFTMTAHDDFTVTGVPDGLTWTATADGTVTNVIPGDGEKAVNAVTSFRIFDFNNVDVTNYFTNIDISATGTLRVIPSMLYLADNADNTAIIGKFNGQGYDVTLQGRKLWKDGYWNTLCLPFDLTAAQVTTQLAPSELKELDVVNTYDEEGNVVANGTYQTKLADDGTLYLYFTDATEISAGTPYIIKWNATTPDYIENPTFKDVVIDKDASTEVTFTGGKFVGSYSPVVWQTENQSVLFLGADNKLYWPQPADADHPVTIGAFRAYFDLGSNTAREFRLFFGDDETQGIISLTPDPSRGGEGSIYTLNGVKLDKMPTRKGLYIYNGNKVVIK